MNNLKEQYDKVCFSLDNAYKKLSQAYINNFILNPEIKQLTSEIKSLQKVKDTLENKIQEEQKNAE